MTLKEIVIATIAQTKFVPNRPYEVYLSFNWGEIEFLIITQAHEGKGTHHSIKFENGRWEQWSTPMIFGDINLQSWSHGCQSMCGWVLSPDIAKFHDDVLNVVEKITAKYTTLLDTEKQKYIDAEKLIKNY